jgi:hypothetical protein
MREPTSSEMALLISTKRGSRMPIRAMLTHTGQDWFGCSSYAVSQGRYWMRLKHTVLGGVPGSNTNSVTT